MPNAGFEGYDLLISDIGFYGQGINVTNFKIIQITKTHLNDLFEDAGAIKTINLWTQPANSRLIALMLRLDIQFAGTSMTGMEVVCGHSGGAANGLLDPNPSTNLITDAVGTEYRQVGSFYGSFYEGIHGKTQAAITWRARATSIGANLDATSAGQATFYIMYEEGP